MFNVMRPFIPFGSMVQENLRAAIQRMFLVDDVGVFYDFATAAQVKEDSLAQAPAAIDGPVGARLDLSRGLEEATLPLAGAALTFSANLSRSGNTFTKVDTSAASGIRFVDVVQGGTYRISFTVSRTSGVNYVQVNKRNETNTADALVFFSYGSGSFSGIAQSPYNGTLSPSGSLRIFIGQDFVGTVTVDSIVQIKGSHAFQPTTANKPTLRRTPTTQRYWIDAFDSARALNATFATAPGEMHVGRVTPEGMAWGTETWAATQNVLEMVRYNAGIVARKREFSADEMALIEAYFRRQLPTLSSSVIADGSFSSGFAGWTASAGTSLAVVNETLEITATAAASFPKAAATIPASADNKQFVFKAKVKKGTSGHHGRFLVAISAIQSLNEAPTAVTESFTAHERAIVFGAGTAGLRRVELIHSAVSATAGTLYFDDVELREIL